MATDETKDDKEMKELARQSYRADLEMQVLKNHTINLHNEQEKVRLKILNIDLKMKEMELRQMTPKAQAR